MAPAPPRRPAVPQQPRRGRRVGRGSHGEPSHRRGPEPGRRRAPAPGRRLPGQLGARLTGRLGGSFRLPGIDDPAPSTARLAAVCGWAAALALLGLPVAGRASMAILTGTPPDWFKTTVVALGVCGIALTAAAFAAIHRRWLPWLLLAAATAPLSASLTLTVTL